MRANDYLIVTKDADYNDLASSWGSPPKVIWLRLGNCPTREIEETLRANRRAIHTLSNDPTLGVLLLA